VATHFPGDTAVLTGRTMRHVTRSPDTIITTVITPIAIMLLFVYVLDSRLRGEIERLETSRKQIAQLAAGDSLALPPEVTSYLDRLREIGASERMVMTERDAWILIAARWPDRIREWMPGKLAELDDPQLVRFYRLGSELFDSDAADDSRAQELADILAGLLEQAGTAGEDLGELTQDDLPFDLLDALADESDPRMKRFRELDRKSVV